MTAAVIGSLLVSLLLLFATWISLTHWWGAVESGRNRRKGIDRHHSMIIVLPQLVVLLAAAIEWASGALVPAAIFWIIALSDLSLWALLYMPIFLIIRRIR